MKIVSWNINGIRASNGGLTIKQILDSLDADIICLQETKVTRDQLPETVANVEGYYAFFSFSRKKVGYSGVVTYCKKHVCPTSAEEGLSNTFTPQNEPTSVGCYNPPLDLTPDEIKSLDGEGRAVITEHEVAVETRGEVSRRMCVFNLYCPRADREDEERFTFKMNFYKLLQARYEKIIKSGKHVVIVGDLNISHKRIDHCDPDQDFEEAPHRVWLSSILKDLPLPPKPPDSERNAVGEDDSFITDSNHTSDCSWLLDKEEPFNRTNVSFMSDSKNDPFLETNLKLVDSFRYFHPDRAEAFTCWNTKTRARETNYGTRIDYILADPTLITSEFVASDIHPDIEGSDHCPVSAILKIKFTAAQTIPKLCSINMPEFAGKQKTIQNFFAKTSMNAESCGESTQNSTTTSKKRKLQQNDKISKKRGTLNDFFVKTEVKYSAKVDTSVENYSTLSSNRSTALTTTIESVALHNTSLSKENNPFRHNLNTKLDPSKVCEKGKQWKGILSGPPKAPSCPGHRELCVLRTVKKPGPNLGRNFYVCNRPDGKPGNKEASCDYFKWKTERK